MRTRQAADAKQHFGQLVEAARREPQALIRQSEAVGVVMSMKHYRGLKAEADAEFASFLCPPRSTRVISTAASE